MTCFRERFKAVDSVDIFPLTSKIKKMVSAYLLIRKNAKIHPRHQSDAIVPRRDGRIDVKETMMRV